MMMMMMIIPNFRSLQKKRWACYWFYLSYCDFRIEFNFLSCRKYIYIYMGSELITRSCTYRHEHLILFCSTNGLSSPNDPCTYSCSREVYSQPLLFLWSVLSQYTYVKLMESAYEHTKHFHLQATRVLFLSITVRVETFGNLDFVSLNCDG